MARGGARIGAGRPAGTSKHGEPTKVMRVPESWVPRISAWLAHGPLPGAAVLQPSPHPPRRFIPLASSSVVAGFPSPADDYIESWLDLNELLVTDAVSTFFVRVKGDSMLDAGIHQGDILVVDRAREAKHGDIVIAVVDGELTVKRLHLKGKHVRLLPENPNYPVIELRAEQELLVWGIVTACVHSFA